MVITQRLGIAEPWSRREVVEIIPVAEKVVTQKEWELLGEHSTSAIPKSRLLPQLGCLLFNCTPEERVQFIRGVPLPIRVLYRLVGRRQFARQFRELFPGEPVPRTM